MPGKSLRAAASDWSRRQPKSWGTGKNPLHLGRLFPKAQLWGLDLSPHMLAVLTRKCRNFLEKTWLTFQVAMHFPPKK
jgi:ubiquinone/menaquinone biosynthesis C-methylase UbiE